MTEYRPAPDVPASLAPFPLGHVLLASLLVGLVYFIPQAMYFLDRGTPQVFFQENPEETTFAVLTARAAGEQPGRPDPYRLHPQAPTPASGLYAQGFPPRALAAIARLFHLPVAVIFWAGSFLFPASVAFLFGCIAWLSGLRDPLLVLLVTALSLLTLPPPFWPLWAKQLTRLLRGQQPEFSLMLPYSRRFQPQFVAVLHYLTIAASLLLLRVRSRQVCRAVAAFCGLSFGLTFYCYFFSWSLLLGWFVLGSVCVWLWRREKWALWWSAFAAGLAVSLPYWVLVLRRFDDFRASAGAGYTHRLPREHLAETGLLLLLSAVLALCLRRPRGDHELLWTPLALNLAAALGVLQNILTGVYLQPFHYLHYFARPTITLALIALLAWSLAQVSIRPPAARGIQAAAWVLIGLVVLSSSFVQRRRYRAAVESAAPVFAALPAMDFLKQHAPPGALVYGLRWEVREALPLYGQAVPYFSRELWTNATVRDEDAILDRIAAMHVLANASEDQFIRLVRSRPWEIFCQYLVRLYDPEAEDHMTRMEATLVEKFRQLLLTADPPALDGLRYLLLPSTTPLLSTRFPRYFACRPVWSDARYSVFELRREAAR